MKMLNVQPFQETLNAGMCGPASLKMILEYWGVSKTEKELAELCKTDKDLGTKATSVQAVAETLGFSVQIKNSSSFKDIEYWLGKKVPVIVDWFTRGRSDYSESDVASGHYSIAVGLDDTHIYLQDPEIGGLRKIKRDDFLTVWFDFAGKQVSSWDEMIVRQIIVIYPAKGAF